MTNLKKDAEKGSTFLATILPAIKVPPQNIAVNINFRYIIILIPCYMRLKLVRIIFASLRPFEPACPEKNWPMNYLFPTFFRPYNGQHLQWSSVRIIMKAYLKSLLLLIFFMGCTAGDVVDVARVAVTGDAVSAQKLAAQKAAGYAVNPKALERDIRNFEKNFAALVKNFRKAVNRIWGKKEAQEPQPKNYVKYTHNYLSRARVDFDQGIITVETLDPKAPQLSLKNAIVATLLTPDDPRAVDLYTAKEVKLGEMPFLYREVVDHQDLEIRWSWRAERFADFLVAQNIKTRQKK